MTLSMNSLHQPMNDFFLSRFGAPEGSPIFFRFDKFGSVISDRDFVDPAQPAAGYSPALAREKLSELVNRIPVDAGDGINVMLSGDSIDDTYFNRFLSPSQPYLPESGDGETRAATMAAFSAVKSRALRSWEQLTLESISGLPVGFKPSDATPGDWYDSKQNDVWTSTSFEIAGENHAADPAAATMVWKLRPDDALLSSVLDLPDAAPAVSRRLDLNLAERAVEMRSNAIERLGADASSAARSPGEAIDVRPARLRIRFNDHRIAATNPAVRERLESNGGRALSDTLNEQLATLHIRRRVLVKEYLEANAPTDPVKTDKITISFDYCLVNIKRQWYADTFVNDTSWWVPGVAKGKFTQPGNPGTLPLLPIGFVVIRRLKIAAEWSDNDRASAAVAASFGPFNVDGGEVSGVVSQPGLQVIGWMLQTMPALPPNSTDDPGPAPAPQAPRSYTVKQGDTLWAIAERTYGDPARWTEIMRANEMADADALAVGQVLTLP